MIPRYIVLNKKVGVTPLEAITAWRAEHPEFAKTPATYAGRLDPMASGKLLILLGDECKRAAEYRGLDKKYEIEVLFGCSTDTNDILGIPQQTSKRIPIASEVRQALATLVGTHTVPYPAYSSKTVHGKPLFQYALEGALDTISIPTHQETIYTAKLISFESVSAEALRDRIQKQLQCVPKSDEPSKVLGSDFRQDEIRAAWDAQLQENTDRYAIARIHVTCASGTYMRTLAKRLAEKLHTNACTVTIHRSTIGTYFPLGPLGFWTKKF